MIKNKRNLIVSLNTVGNAIGAIAIAAGALTGCDSSFGTGYFAEIESAATDPSGLSSPSPSPLESSFPSPSPSPSSCTQTCSVPNGVGVETCGEPSTCTLTQCNPGYVVNNGACVPSSTVSSFVCMSYEKLVLNEMTNELTTSSGDPIPAQEAGGSGVCYYYPIVDVPAPLSGASYLTGTAAADHDQDVVARDHDANAGNPDYDWHPYIMKHSDVNLTFVGARTLHLTGGNVVGNNFDVADVQIDNFFLVGVYPSSTNLSPANLLSYYSAWGTADSVIDATVNGANASGIAFNPAGISLTTNATTTYPNGDLGNYSNDGLKTASPYALIPLNAEASGGTANVPEVSLTNLISSEVNMTVDFHALDCGSARTLSDVYLLIQ